MDIFQLRVSIIGIPKLYRLIDISGNCSFEDLHDMIFTAFDRYDPHLYSFFLTMADTKNIRAIYDSPEITHPQNVEDVMGYGRKKRSAAKTRISDAELSEKDVFHYLFDFGDDWWHRIRVQKIGQLKTDKKHMKLIKSVGKSPDQYPDYEDEEYEAF
jgi:hypothetical protein